MEGCLLSVQLPDEKLVCIVKFRDDLAFGMQIPQSPAVHFQVTVDKDKCSRGGKFIRFGEHPGDELVGWMVREYLLVCEVLGSVDENGVVSLGFDGFKGLSEDDVNWIKEQGLAA